MKRTVRVGLSFASLPKNELNSFAILVIVCLKNSALFPDLPIPLTELTALQAAYQDAMNAAAVGGQKDTAALHDARDNLIAPMRQIAAYIQSLGLTEAQVLTSGFDVVSWRRNRTPLEAPVVTDLDNAFSTRLQVLLQVVPNAKTYQVQYCTGAGPWQEAGIFPGTRNIAIAELTPGTVYTVRVRAVGGSTQYSPWSASISKMAT